jgi:polysaccharide biosynthesis protein PelA
MPGSSRVVTSSAALAVLASAALLGAAGRSGGVESARWAVCYSEGPSPFDLAAYDVVVLDADRHPPLAPMTERGRTVLAYLSTAEAGRGRRYFPALQAAGAVLGAHPVWTDAHYIDLRRPEWTRLVIEDLVPRALEAGFSGIFLDTLDDAPFLEAQDPARYAGMQRAAADLVRAIRHHYPAAVLMVNRGYALMPEIAGSIDILLGESVLSTFDGTSKAYRRVSPADAAWQIAALRDARGRNPKLRLFTLDYWDPADRDGVSRLYREQRANGFVPYVSTPLLDKLIGEPR